MITREELKGHWNEIRGRIKDRWQQLTDDDLRQAEGSTEELIGVIQRTTGEGVEQISNFLNTMALIGGEQVGSVAHQVAETAQHYAHEATKFAEEGYQNASQHLQDRVHQAEDLVRKRPVESVAVAFGVGVVAGVLVALVMRSR
jgi:uncharacterized protein YjbJ (UPF0337 family)